MKPVMRRLKTAVLSGWSFVVLGILIAWTIPYQFPQWSAHVTQFVSAYPLLVGVLLLALLYLALWKLPHVSTVGEEKDRVDLEWKARQTMAQLLGGAFLLAGLFFTAKTLQVSQQTLQASQEGQITDRFAKAVAQLGEDKLIVRLGGIYSLGRIAKDSTEKDSQTVMNVLTAFVRERAPLNKKREVDPSVFAKPRDSEEWERLARHGPPPPDIQAILSVIKKRIPGQISYLDLSDTDLQEAVLYDADFLRDNFRGANLRAVNFFGSVLRGVYFEGANLAGANLHMSSLYGSNFEGANLKGANLRGAILDTPISDDPPSDRFKKAFPAFFSPEMQQLGADLKRAGIGSRSQANLKGANLKRADLRGAKLQTVIDLTQEQVNDVCVNDQTELPRRLQKPQPCRDLPD